MISVGIDDGDQCNNNIRCPRQHNSTVNFIVVTFALFTVIFKVTAVNLENSILFPGQDCYEFFVNLMAFTPSVTCCILKNVDRKKTIE
jgi:hypothetical protein